MAGPTQVVERFTIRTSADLDAARFALEHGGDHVVLLDVPLVSSQLTGVREYRDLVTLAEVCGMRVCIMSDDPVRLELARIVGMEVADQQAITASRPADPFGDLASLSHTNVTPSLRRRRVGQATATRPVLRVADANAETSHQAPVVPAGHGADDADATDDPSSTAVDEMGTHVAAMSSTAVRRADDPTRRIASTLAQPERFRPWQAPGAATPGAPRGSDVALSPDAADPSFAFLSASTRFPARATGPTAAADTSSSQTHHRRAWTSTAPVASGAAPMAAGQTAVRPQLQADPRVAGLSHRPATERRTRRRSRSRWVGVLIALLLVGGLLGGGGYAAAVVLPSANVTITPQQQPVDVTLTYGVASPGATWDILIEPTTTGRTVTASATLDTTGERLEPDQAARGQVLITNPLTWDVAITVGTTFVADDGQVFTSTEDTVVPAADPLGTLTFGSTTVSVVAAVGGSAGNVAPDAISGQLDAGVYFTNRTAFGGGTDRVVPIVQQADIDALQARLRDDVQRQVPDAAAGLTANTQYLPGSEQTSDVTFDIPLQVGADATQISGNATATVSVAIFSLDAAQEEARELVQQRLQAAVATDQQIVANSIRLGTPEALDASGTAYRVRASGTAVAVLDEQALEALREDLAGASTSDARARFMAQPGVAAVEIETHWSWLAGGLPERTERIDVDLVDSAALYTATGTNDSTGSEPAIGPATGTPTDNTDGGPARTPAGTPEGAGAGASPTTGP